MSIAQHSVAGEALIRLPQLSSYDSAIVTTPTESCFSAQIDPPTVDLTDVVIDTVTDATNLKWITLRAVHRAQHFIALPSRARAVLAALARTVDIRTPEEKIFASRDVLCDRALVSTRTLFRALLDLQQAGLIVRHGQWEVGGRAGYNRAYLSLTRHAAALLGFHEKQSAERGPAMGGNASRARALASTVGSRDGKTQTNNEGRQEDAMAPVFADTRSATVADPIERDLSPSKQKRQPSRLPPDLTRLLTLGFHEFLVFKLMGEASAHQKKLSDVVECSWKHIASARRPINYVRALLTAPTDFGAITRQRLAEQSRAHQQKAKHDMIDQTIHAAAGKTFFDTAGLTRMRVDAHAQTVFVESSNEAVPRVASGAWKAPFVASLIGGRIVPATAALEMTFQQASQRRLLGTSPSTPTSKTDCERTKASHVDMPVKTSTHIREDAIALMRRLTCRA